MEIRKILWLIVGSISLLVAGCVETSTNPNTTDPEPEPDNPPAVSEVEITNITPEEGYAGDLVTITGSGFSSTPSDLTVTFGGLEAKVETASETKVEAIVPDGAETGTVQITIGGETAAGPTFTVLEADEPEPDPVQEPYNVEGRITDGQTGGGIEGVIISFSNEMEPVHTDGNGNWYAEDLMGPVAVTVEAEGLVFPIQTRLVLGPADDVDFEAYAVYKAPRSNRIAYQFRSDCSSGTGCDKPYSIWTMTSSGYEKEQLTDTTGSDHHPSWSPDATRIAFDSNRAGDNHIWIMNADGSEPTNTELEGYQPAWSPDGDRIAYVLDGNIRTMDLQGNSTEIFKAGGEYGYASSPDWSPDGSKIAFELREGSGGERHIWVMEADGRHVTQLTHENSPNRNPEWEATGSRILYDSGNITWRSSRLRIMNADGSNDHIKAEWKDRAQSDATWSPNGQEIIYVHRRMIPISNRVEWMPFDNDAWMPIAPDNPYANEEFWAESPAWAPMEL